MDEDGSKKRITHSSPTNLKSSNLALSSISHQSSSSLASSSSSSSSNNEIESQRSSVDSIFGSVPTNAEVEDSIQEVERFVNAECNQQMVDKNSGFQPIHAALQLVQMPKAQDMVKSLMRDTAFISAMWRNQEVQAFIISIVDGSSIMRLTNGNNTVTSSTNMSQSSNNWISIILNWLLENMESGIITLFGTLRSLLNITLGSTGIENPGSNYGKYFYLAIVLCIINLLIVFITRAMKQRLKI